MPGTVNFGILGPLRAWVDDAGERDLDLGPAKQRQVLAVLLLRAGHPVPTTRILDAVWQEDLPANGSNVVQQNVARLRRVLEPDRSPRAPGRLLSLTDGGYVLLADPDAVDASRFERRVRRAQDLRARGEVAAAAAEVRAALNLWRGEPLGDLAGPFFDAARVRFNESRAAATELWAELELALGHHRELVPELIRLVAEFPVREMLRRGLMLALYRSGRRTDALAAYHEIRTLLVEEYGLEPGPELDDLHTRMLRGDPSLSAPDPAVAAAVVPDAPATVEPVRVVPSVPPAPPSVPPAPANLPQHGVPAAGQPWPARSGFPAPAVGAIPPAGAWPPGAGQRPAGRRWVANLLTVLGVLTALGSVGLLTWLVVLCYGIHRHSPRIISASAGYAAITAFLIAYAMTDAGVDQQFDGYDLLGFAASLVPLLGGPLHIVLLNPQVRALLAGPESRMPVDPGRIRREQFRLLLHQHPAAREELRIGRPDLPRSHDDGGLVDVNSVADHVLWHLPGLTPEQGRQIAVDRWSRGPYTSVEDLAARCLLSPAQTERLREVLLFLPPLAPAPSGPPAPPVAFNL